MADYCLLGGSPGVGRRVAELAVADAGKFDQIDHVACCSGGTGIAPTLFDRHDLVSESVDHRDGGEAGGRCSIGDAMR